MIDTEDDGPWLRKLAISARVYGHLGDYPAVVDFVRFVFDELGHARPDLEPMDPEQDLREAFKEATA